MATPRISRPRTEAQKARRRELYHEPGNKRRESNARWARERPERTREYSKRSREKNADAIRERNRKWAAQHKEERAEYARARNASPEGKAKREAYEAKKLAEDPEFFKRICNRSYSRHWGRNILRAVQKRSRKAGIDCDLTEAWMNERLARGTCEMSGLEFRREGRWSPFSPSIDRINPGGPYTQSNCRLVIWILNRALANYGDDLVLDVFRRVLDRRDRQGAAVLKLAAD